MEMSLLFKTSFLVILKHLGSLSWLTLIVSCLVSMMHQDIILQEHLFLLLRLLFVEQFLLMQEILSVCTFKGVMRDVKFVCSKFILAFVNLTQFFSGGLNLLFHPIIHVVELKLL